MGQDRADQNTGQGANVFKDRGAIERADFEGPSAILLDPRDNGPLDQEPADTIVQLLTTMLTGFSIQLIDAGQPSDPMEGVGINDASVSRDNVLLFQDGVLLQEGVDYAFSYLPTNNVIVLTPLAGIFELDKTYVIQLVNVDAFLIPAPDGGSVADGDSFDVADDAGGAVSFEFDSGYSIQTPPTLTLHVPLTAGAGIADGETFTINDGAKTVVFEFDRNNVSVVGEQGHQVHWRQHGQRAYRGHRDGARTPPAWDSARSIWAAARCMSAAPPTMCSIPR